MRALAWLILAFGPLLSLPAAAGLWAHARLASDLYVPAAVAVALLLEGLLIWRRGVLREATVLALSGFCSTWAWLALARPHPDWTALPSWRAPDARGLMVILLSTLVCLMVYAAAERRRIR